MVAALHEGAATLTQQKMLTSLRTFTAHVLAAVQNRH